MFCGTRAPKIYPTAEKLRADFVDPNNRQKPFLKDLKKVFGTWDFKWPLGYKIRVAFQKLPADQPELQLLSEKQRTDLLAAGIAELIKYANRWVTGTSGPAVGIDFVWMSDPRQWWSEPSSAEVSSSNSPREVDYDVLVSLAPLPVTDPDTPEAPGELQTLPRSQLGSYARRSDAGVPTVYVGRAYYLTDKLSDYFQGDQFHHCVVHEFGHVLGLAHANQNPLLDPRPNWKPADQIANIFGAAIQKPVTSDMKAFAQSEVIQPWPAAVINGAVKFSDWLPDRPDSTGKYAFDSIMVDPLLTLYMEGGPVMAPSDLPAFAKKAFTRGAPSASDLALLAAMYRVSGQR